MFPSGLCIYRQALLSALPEQMCRQPQEIRATLCSNRQLNKSQVLWNNLSPQSWMWEESHPHQRDEKHLLSCLTSCKCHSDCLVALGLSSTSGGNGQMGMRACPAEMVSQPSVLISPPSSSVKICTAQWCHASCVASNSPPATVLSALWKLFCSGQTENIRSWRKKTSRSSIGIFSEQEHPSLGGQVWDLYTVYWVRSSSPWLQ